MLHKLFSLAYTQVFAQTDFVPLEGSLPDKITYSTDDLSGFLIGWFTVLVGAVTVLAVVWIVLGGIQYMSTDAYSGKSEGKKKITNALVGLLLAGLSYVILYTIDPRILNIKLNYTGEDTTGTNVEPPTGSGNIQGSTPQDETQGTGSYSSDVVLEITIPFASNRIEHVKVSGQTVEECLKNVMSLRTGGQEIVSHTPCKQSE